ncbi:MULTISPECIES: mechanosensitive ion channel family protein [unclassified Microbulbifer]|uniref:Mechanosensitive ion channel family protein n=1 Tax=Microbulbifer spongiae TaxID=2944933 RepID=A0ABY9EJC8_9GAMM|nr:MULTISPECIES: mechanosensitive ion channel family protein [unclassified Microbulbifer]MDP5208669.1 mechanosensitive ion channel family protein [Microbulbifer sp. 2205BS26-8]WKD51336.1 mechanosensitive ion channel family protein [Microbulbifer sp. MI-G]
MESVEHLLLTWFGENRAWIVIVFLFVLIAAVVAWMYGRFVLRFAARAEKTENPWDDALVRALSPPGQVLAWLLGLTLAAQYAGRATGAEIFSVAEPVREIGLILVLAWFAWRFSHSIECNLSNPRYIGKPMDATTVRAIGKLVRASIAVTAGIVIMQFLGYSVSGLLAFGGIGGLAVGFAAKDLLANFFGGLMIYLDRPFAVGDWIRSPDKEIEGTVEDIGWRLTRIRTFDLRPVYVPNSIFTQIAVENPSRMLNRRIFETIGIRYEDAHLMAPIVSDVKAMLQRHPEIDVNRTLIVNFNSFAASSLDFFVYTFTRTTDWIRFHEIKQEILLSILKIVESHGASCAFPTSTVHIADIPSLTQEAVCDSSPQVQ